MVVFVAEGIFRRAVLRHIVLHLVERTAQCRLVGFVVFGGVDDGVALIVQRGLLSVVGNVCGGFGGFFRRRERNVGLPDVDVAVAVGIFCKVVLMVFLGLVEGLQWQVFHDQRLFMFFLFARKRLVDNRAFGGVG